MASSIETARARLEHGQSLETQGHFAQALAAYDQAAATLGPATTKSSVAVRHTLGLVRMNRGNALQKIGTSDSIAASIRAYDDAIAVFQTLPVAAEPLFRNHLGAAWLNRGHALIVAADAASAASFEQAIAHFEQLPPNDDPYFRLNLAGAWTNLAHVRLASDPAQARAAARQALETLADVERRHPAFTAMSLRARRALVMSLGELLQAAEAARQPINVLASEATDAIDEGLALARETEATDASPLQPLAARLFRMGAHLYRVHQPHFLAEFVLEHLAAPAFASDAEFRTIAQDSVATALADLQRPQLFVADSRAAERMLETVRSLRAAQQRLAAA